MSSNLSIPIYISRSTARSLWQEYRIYHDHLELDTLFGKLTIPFEVIERLELRPSDVKELLTKGELQLKNFRPALKIDWANFQEHVVLDKNEGWIKRILFTPDNAQVFQEEFQAAIEQFRRNR